MYNTPAILVTYREAKTHDERMACIKDMSSSNNLTTKELIHELVNRTINPNGYAEDLDKSDKRNDSRIELESEITNLINLYRDV